MKRYDVIVVGAGTAGCSAAIHLPAGARALVIDRAGPEAERCCGGLMAHDAQSATARLGLELPAGVRVRPEPRDVRVTDLDSGRTQTYRRNYWNLDRPGFDCWLAGRAAGRAELRYNCGLVSVRPDAGGLAVTLVSDHRQEEVGCAHLVAADGANSRVRRLLFGTRPAPRVAIALQALLPPAAHVTNHEVLFSSVHTDFYAWLIPKPAGLLVGSAFAHKARARALFDDLLAVMANTYHLAGPALDRCSRPLFRPARRAELLAGGDRVLLCGEAAGLVSPSSGEGISFALESGAAAGAALADARPAAAYARAFRPLAGRVARKFVKARVIFSPPLRRLALRLPFYP